jgi:hypothetical protein
MTGVSTVQLVMLTVAVESPVWLLHQGRDMDAKEALSVLWTPEQQADQENALADSSSEPGSLSEDPALDAAVPLLPQQDENPVWLSVE